MKLKSLSLIFLSLVFSLSLVSFAYAQNLPNAASTPGSVSFPNGASTPAPASQNQNSSGQFQVVNPLGVTSVCGLIKGVLNGALAIGIPIAVLFIVYAGFKFVLALGNPSKLTEARTNMLYTVIGIAIFLGAWLLSQVIINTVNALGQGSASGTTIQSC